MKNYNLDIIRLNNMINKDNSKDTVVLRTLFNSIIAKYPDKTWLGMLDNFFVNMPVYSNKDIMIYTILSYKLDNTFTSLNPFVQKELIYSLVTSDISYYNMVKYARLLLSSNILEKITIAYQNHLINPHYIFKLILKHSTLEAFNETKILSIIDKFIKEHELKLFNGNYNFFNVYHCLKKLINLDYYQEDISALELIPLLEELDDSTKVKIKEGFKRIEQSNKNLMEKINDAITLTVRYSYELNLYRRR